MECKIILGRQTIPHERYHNNKVISFSSLLDLYCLQEKYGLEIQPRVHCVILRRIMGYLFMLLFL